MTSHLHQTVDQIQQQLFLLFHQVEHHLQAVTRGNTGIYVVNRGHTGIYAVNQGNATGIYAVNQGNTGIYAVNQGNTTAIYAVNQGSTAIYAVNQGNTGIYAVNQGNTTGIYSVNQGNTGIYAVNQRNAGRLKPTLHLAQVLIYAGLLFHLCYYCIRVLHSIISCICHEVTFHVSQEEPHTAPHFS